MAAKAFYLETLDMGEAMRRAEVLKSNALRLAREELNREGRETRERLARNAAGERFDEREAAGEERARNLAGEALDIEEADTGEEAAPPLMEYTLRFRGTERQLLKLREYMTAHGIAYERIA